MKIFVATSYSTKVDYNTGQVVPEYKEWLEANLDKLEEFGHEVFCSLRADEYKINDADPAEAFKLDVKYLEETDALIAFVDSNVSAGVQLEIGYALALKKRVILAHSSEDDLAWFNMAIVKAGQASDISLPIESDPLT